jgi:hypothetical protein
MKFFQENINHEYILKSKVTITTVALFSLSTKM